MINKEKNRSLQAKKNALHFRGDKSTRHGRERVRKMQGGQILIIVVFAIIGLIGFVGLVVDTGLVFVANGKLRRGTDAAALAAAAAYRNHPDSTSLNEVAMEYLTLNQVDNGGASIHLLCDTSDPEYDSTQCTPAKRRLVKVDTTSVVNLAFLPVIGIRTVTLNATATSEAASLDIVLALDVSESMTFDSPPTNLLRDPAECNNVPAGNYTLCEPFEKIQKAAVQFVDTLITNDNTYDRIAVIPFDRNAHSTKAGLYNDPLYLTDNYSGGTLLTPAQYRTRIENEIQGLRVYNGSGSVPAGGPLTDGSCLYPDGEDHSASFTQGTCRNYPHNKDGYCFDVDTNAPLHLTPTDSFTPNCWSQTPTSGVLKGPYTDGTNFYQRAYQQLICPTGVDPKYCGTTNTGGAFNAAGNEFTSTRVGPFRQESLWVVIMLTDGIANHADNNTWCPTGDGTNCQDTTVATNANGSTGRHCLDQANSVYAGLDFFYNSCHNPPPDGGGGTVSTAQYDADDYARDMADFVSLGQQALVYTIGFGADMQHVDPISNSASEQLLNYAADIGDDGKVNTPAGQANPDYFYAPNATKLNDIFTTIAQRIATRLTH